MPKTLFKQQCPYCGERTITSSTKGGSMLNRDKHIANCEQAPSREREKARSRTHWS